MIPAIRDELDGQAVSMAKQIAQAAIDFERETTGRGPSR